MKLLKVLRNRKFQNQDEAESLPFKFSVRFEDMSEAELKAELAKSVTNLAIFKLLPYQKQADIYLECTVRYDGELTSVYYQIRRLDSGKVVYATDYYPIDGDVLNELSKRAGQKIRR